MSLRKAQHLTNFKDILIQLSARDHPTPTNAARARLRRLVMVVMAIVSLRRKAGSAISVLLP